MKRSECHVFDYCDLENHDDMDDCCSRMDHYYSVIVDGRLLFYCAKCQFICVGDKRKAIFYRDHGVHLGKMTSTEKKVGIMNGNVYIYFISILIFIYFL